MMKNKFLWELHTRISGLPEAERDFLDKLLGRKEQYKEPDESPFQYLKRVLRSFDIYERDNMLIAKDEELCLYFEITEKEEISPKPCYDGLNGIPVRIHRTDIRYSSFSTNGEEQNFDEKERFLLLHRINLVD